ncbi:MAG: NAD-dependent epimerase/dehydratase family protein [Lentisphaerae bacterium]|jgi:GDP-4-dehydro-6-deoxy-D-mannose reductase|nr:NAD-dependent epimerase/dehydratase family protein [Lentisphaerota bacterium]
MRVLVTGVAGFVGRHLLSSLRAAGHEPLPTDSRADESAGIAALDIRDAGAVDAAIGRLKPDACIHLAGISFVPDAARDPLALDSINVAGTLHVAQALLHHVPCARLLFISTSQVYGTRNLTGARRESEPLDPASPYAGSKARAEAALQELAAHQNLNLVIARPGNHTGPGQAPKFVAPAFAAAIRDFRDGRLTSIAVGNLDSERDFSDVRDVVAAYLLLLEKGETGGIYNISSGNHVRIGTLLTELARIAGVTPVTHVEPSRYRPTDAVPTLDTTRLRALGWQPAYPLERTLADLWREVDGRQE